MRPIFGKTIYFTSGFLIMVLLASIAYGANERIVMGPYDVQFDLNTSLNYTIEAEPPLASENTTAYRANIILTNDTQILMGIDESSTPRDSTLESEERFVKALALQDRNATVAIRTVDNRPGILTLSIGKSGRPTFTFSYWLDSQKCSCGNVSAGRTRFQMVGVVPINITESLLNTLHVMALSNVSAPIQPGMPRSSDVENLSGAQGAAIARGLQPQPPLTPGPSAAIPPGLSGALAGNVGPEDPAYYYLYHWAQGDLSADQILEDISRSGIRY